MEQNTKVSFLPLNASDEDIVYKLYNDELVYETAVLAFLYPYSDLQVRSKIENWVKAIDQKHFVISCDHDRVGLAQIYNICFTNRKCNIGILALRYFMWKQCMNRETKRLSLCQPFHSFSILK